MVLSLVLGILAQVAGNTAMPPPAGLPSSHGAPADLEPSWSDALAATQAKVVKLYRSSLSYVDFVVPKIRMLSQVVPSSIMVKS